MDIVAFCEADPDWIQFTNAHVQLSKYRNSYLTFLDRAPLHFLGPNDTLLVVGHGNAQKVGAYNAGQIVNLLIRQGLRKNSATIRFQTCSSGDSQVQFPVLVQIKYLLIQRGYGQITVQGAKAPSITGWRHTDERVVPHNRLGQAGLSQNVSIFQNNDQIERAKAHITKHFRPNLTSRQLTDIARVVHTYSANFFMDFSNRVEPFTVSSQTGFRSL